MEKLKIGVSIGDINGVGLEVILKTFSNERLATICTPVIYGSSKVLSYHKNIVDADVAFNSTKSADRLQEGKVNVVNCWNENVSITLGRATDVGGKYALQSLEVAVRELKAGLIDALVTAPINKEAMKMAGFPFPGHTEYLASELKGSPLMLMIKDDLRVGLVTGHVALSEVSEMITKERILKRLHTLQETLKVDFRIERPTIAVLGLNPHASDGGLMGEEEEKHIRPAIIEAKKKGIVAMGPYAADGFFASGTYKKFDAILAMYHDQGLIPFKTLATHEGVNYTAGLSGVRTSPDHGTAYDIVGKNLADPSSFRSAVFAAMDIARNRFLYNELHENKLEKHSERLEQVEERVEDIKED